MSATAARRLRPRPLRPRPPRSKLPLVVAKPGPPQGNGNANPPRGEKRAADVIGGGCKPRSNNPSLNRPGIPVAPEKKSGSRQRPLPRVGRGVGNEGRRSGTPVPARADARSASPTPAKPAPSWPTSRRNMQGMSVDPDQRRLLVRAPMMQTGGAVSPVVIRGRRLIP